MTKPALRPTVAHFSSGPCAKRPGWNPALLENALVGRSHRAKEPKARLAKVIEDHRKVLGIPADYRIGIVPASDTGAVEMALWSLLGERGVDVLAWESFGSGWAGDATKELKLADTRVIKAGYGQIPDLSKVDFSRDVIFTWNGTTSGVRVPDGDWIPADHDGLVICDATSAVFAYDMPWSKLDVVTWSWQKVLGGEGGHGMIVLSPRAAKRLETYNPAWPIPKIFRMSKDGKLIEGIFKGETINTPSMLCVEDVLDGLAWVEGIGGLKATIARSAESFAAIDAWTAQSSWIKNLADEPSIRSTTSVCLKVVDPWFTALGEKDQDAVCKAVVALLDKEAVAYDIGAYRDAPAGFRIWAGATVDPANIKALLPWLDWAYAETRAGYKPAAA